MCPQASPEQTLEERIKGCVLGRGEALRLIKACKENRIDLLVLSTAAPSDLSKSLSTSQRQVQELQLPQHLFQWSVQCQLKKMQAQGYKVEMLEDAAEAISKVARTVQDLKGVTVDKLAEVGVPLLVRAWLCQHHLIQGSQQNVQPEKSVEELPAVLNQTSDPRYVLMEGAVREVNKEMANGFESQPPLTTLSESSCKDYVEYDQYAQHGIFMAENIPETEAEHLLANAALHDQGFILVNGESLAIKVAHELKSQREGKHLFNAVCYDENAARKILKSQEVVLTGVDTESGEESDEAERTSDGFEPCAAMGGEWGEFRSKPLPEPDQRKFNKTPNITAILMCIYAYLLSVRCETIFQKFKPNKGGFLSEDVGDARRLQSKIRQLPDVQQKPGESDSSFFRKSAGKIFLCLFLQRLCFLVCNWLPAMYTIDRLWDDLYAGIVKTLALASGQYLHADKEPDRHGVGASVLINLSVWSHWITSLLRSCKNIEALLQYYRDNYDLFATLYLANNPSIIAQKLSEEDLNKSLQQAWQCHLGLYVRDNPSAFRPMKLVDIELVPFMIKVFNLNHVHGGGPYPGKVPRRLRDYSANRQKRRHSSSTGKWHWRYSYGQVHFRSGQIDSSFTWIFGKIALNISNCWW